MTDRDIVPMVPHWPATFRGIACLSVRGSVNMPVAAGRLEYHLPEGTIEKYQRLQ